jgi:GTP-binding protein HflX
MLERPRGGDRAVLVNLDFGDVDFAESLEEIRRLAESADVKPVTVVKGRRQSQYMASIGYCE